MKKPSWSLFVNYTDVDAIFCCCASRDAVSAASTQCWVFLFLIGFVYIQFACTHNGEVLFLDSYVFIFSFYSSCARRLGHVPDVYTRDQLLALHSSVVHDVQLNFIYMASNHNNSRFSVLYVGRWKPNNQTFLWISAWRQREGQTPRAATGFNSLSVCV